MNSRRSAIMSEQYAKVPYIRVTTIDDGIKCTMNFPYTFLHKTKFTEDEKFIIMTLYHEANNKTLYKNSERVFNGIIYGVEIS